MMNMRTCLLCLCTLAARAQPGGSYEASGAHYSYYPNPAAQGPMSDAELRQFQLAAEIARQHGVCDSAAPLDSSDLDAALERFITCGFVVIGPGMLPQLSDSWLKKMTKFAHNMVAKKPARACGPTPNEECTTVHPNEVVPEMHSIGRGDMWPPYHKDFPFGARLVAALADLSPLLTPLFGEEASLEFISVLYAQPGAAGQSWHGEGRGAQVELDPAGCLRQQVRVPVLASYAPGSAELCSPTRLASPLLRHRFSRFKY
jgi:hypothetical protein